MMAKRDSVMSEAKQSSSGSLSVEVDAGETAWTALGDLDVEAAVREIATAIAGHVGVPSMASGAIRTSRPTSCPFPVRRFPVSALPEAIPGSPAFWAT